MNEAQNDKGIEFITKQELIKAWNSLAKDNIRKLFCCLKARPKVLFLLLRKILTLFNQEIIQNIRSIYNQLSLIFKYRQDGINLDIQSNHTLEKVMKPMLKEYHKDIFLNRNQSNFEYGAIIDKIKHFYHNDPLIKPYVNKEIKTHLNKIFTLMNNNLLSMFDNITKIFVYLELHEPTLCISLQDEFQYHKLQTQNESSSHLQMISVFHSNNTNNNTNTISNEYVILIPSPQFKHNQFPYNSFQPIVCFKPLTKTNSKYKDQSMKNKLRFTIFERTNYHINNNNNNNTYKKTCLHPFSSRNSNVIKHHSSNIKVNSLHHKGLQNDLCNSHKEFFNEKTKLMNKRFFNYDIKLTSCSKPHSKSKNKNRLTISTEFDGVNHKHKNGRNNHFIKHNTDENEKQLTIQHDYLSKVPSQKRFKNVAKTEKGKKGMKSGISIYRNYCFKNKKNYNTRMKYCARLNKKIHNAQIVKTSLSNPNLKKIINNNLLYAYENAVTTVNSKQEISNNAFTSRSNAGK